jgi:hypothetical protein
MRYQNQKRSGCRQTNTITESRGVSIKQHTAEPRGVSKTNTPTAAQGITTLEEEGRSNLNPTPPPDYTGCRKNNTTAESREVPPTTPYRTARGVDQQHHRRRTGGMSKKQHYHRITRGVENNNTTGEKPQGVDNQHPANGRGIIT